VSDPLATTARELAPGDYLYLADVRSWVCVVKVARRGRHVTVGWYGGTVRLDRDAPVASQLADEPRRHGALLAAPFEVQPA
jgi:hypothetical protein